VVKTGFAKDHLKSFVDRIERLNEEREALSADIREVFAEAKGTGFDTKIMRQVIRMRKLDKADFQEQEAMLDLYLTAMDMRDSAPLLDYSVRESASESPAKADVEAASQEPNDELVVESVSRPDARRSASATSERMDETGGESAAPMEIPAFLVRTKPPPEPVPA
jgi:uncharacterized protein (UPF0335 family)